MSTQKTVPLIPYLTVDNASAAVEFYVQAFGAKEIRRQAVPGGTKLLHAEVEINGSRLMLSDDFPEFHGGVPRSARALGGSPVTLHITSENAEAIFTQAVKAGAKVEMPFAEQFWGSRYGSVRDPYGFAWSMGTPEKPMTDDQLRKGAQQAMSAKA